LAPLDARAKPVSLADALSHACTCAVTSMEINCPDVETPKLPSELPTAGAVAAVTLYSPHGTDTGETVTAPEAFTRFTKTVSIARETCAEVVPAGSVLRSNCRKVVLPLPTYRFESAP
jgi:hypothetical protein